MQKSILSIQEVVKTYGTYKAVNGVSFDMPEGCIFGLLGPNGAGKSSLIRMITTITRPDAGTIFFNGERLNSKHPEHIGYMPEERGLYKKMKVGEQLLYLAQLKGLSYNEARKALRYWFEKFDIVDWWDKKVEELSKGMQQKAQFIATVVHNPRLLILDEPFSGLDPVNAELLKNEIFELHKQGVSIIFSTHRMEQVEEICDNIILINKGEKILHGAVKDIKQTYKDNIFAFQHETPLPEGLIDGHNTILSQTPQYIRVKLPDGEAARVLLQKMLAQGVAVTAFQEILPSLNDIFIKKVTGETETPPSFNL